MAHKQKYIVSSVGHMFMHYDRSKTVPDLSNPVNTNLNYNLANDDQPLKQLDFLHQRLSEIHVHNRKDVNVMVDWVVTMPKTLINSEDEKVFFKATYDFLNERYGKENVISAYVHKDEVTPHMHYSFVPAIEDKKRDGYKLSAKEVITRNDLRTFHGDLSKHLEKTFGRDVGILNEATKDGNKSIQELKRQSASERLEEATVKASKIVSKADKHVDVAKHHIRTLNVEYRAKKAYIHACDKLSDISKNIPDYAEVKERGIFNKTKYITVPLEKWEAKHVSMHEKDMLEYALNRFEKETSELSSSASAQYLQSLENQNKELKSELISLKSDIKSLKIKEEYLEENINDEKLKAKQDKNELVERIKRTLNKIPDESAELFKKEWNLEIEWEHQREKSHDFER